MEQNELFALELEAAWEAFADDQPQMERLKATDPLLAEFARQTFINGYVRGASSVYRSLGFPTGGKRNG